MRKIIAAGCTLLAFAVTGCVQLKMDTVIKEDGSGTFTMIYAMSQDVQAALDELSQMDMPGQEDQDAPMLDDFDQDTLEEACELYNVKLTKFERGTVDAKDQLEIQMEFKCVEDLARVLASTTGDTGGIGIFKKEDGNYVLMTADYDVEPIGKAAEEAAKETDAEEVETTSTENMDPEAAGKAMELMGKLMASASELDITMNITLPSEVVSHNAMRVEGNTLIWEVNAENMMSAQNFSEPEAIFSGKGVKIDAPAWEE